MRCSIPAFCVLLTGLAIPCAAEDTPRIIWPSLGRPAFLAPGADLRLVFESSGSWEGVELALVRKRAGLPDQRIPLDLPEDLAERAASGSISVRIPPATPAQTYDIELRSAAGVVRQRHCVAVGQFGRSIRLVHLSNMNIGALHAPRFDAELIREINLLDPTCIIATGDLLDASGDQRVQDWNRLVDYFSGFNAPVVFACGDHDNLALYSRHIASSPIGLVPIGPHRVLVLFDQPLAPLDADSDQIQWVERTLTQPGFTGTTFVASHDERPGLLSHWRKEGTLSRMIKATRIGVWFSGGHQDWDGREYAGLIDEASPVLYLRTHESSGAMLDGASGTSHYRVLDVIGPSVQLPGTTGRASASTPSLAVGGLRADFDQPNDGSSDSMELTVANQRGVGLNRLTAHVRLKKIAGFKPWAHGAVLEAVRELDNEWFCRLRFDAPEKSVSRIRVGSGAEPARSPLTVRFELPSELELRAEETSAGVRYLSGGNRRATVIVENRGSESASCTPMVRLDGSPLAYRLADEDGAFVTAALVRLQAGQSLRLRLDLSAVRVRPGLRELQVYLQRDGAVVPFVWPVEIRVADGPLR